MKYIFIFLILLSGLSGGFAQQKHHPAKPATSKAATVKKPDQPNAVKPQAKELPVKKAEPKKKPKAVAVKKPVKTRPARRQRSTRVVIIQKSAPPDNLQRQHFQQEGIHFVKPANKNRR